MSRLTFRNRADGVCYQKQLRDKYINSGIPPIDLNIGFSTVREISYRLARQIILKYEWLGTMANTSHHYGLFFGPYCAGVTCVGFNAGANIYSFKQFGIESHQMAYLARGANVHWSPPGANSKLVSWTCRLLSKSTVAKIIIAYSDSDAGEIGTIYQACNWLYIGTGSSTKQFVSPQGRVYDQKLAYDLSRRRGNTRKEWAKALIRDGWKQQDSNPKHKYVYILDKKDKELLGRIEKMRLPYPKRAMRSADGGNLTTSEAGRFDSDQAAFNDTGQQPVKLTDMTPKK